MKFLLKLLASGLGSGFSPIAPGTAGSALAAVVSLLLGSWWSVPKALGLAGLTFFLGVYCTGRVEKDWGHDNGKMVIDEVAGMFLSLAFVPISLRSVLLAFFVFRALDIVKPQPARAAEALPGGWGVMADDLVAGAYTAVIVWGAAKWM